MDGKRFDNLTRVLARGTTRRQALKAAGAALGGLFAAAGRRETDAAVCRQAGATCLKDAQCCSDSCDLGRYRCACLAGLTLCGRECVRLGTDINCHACGDACTSPTTCGGGGLANQCGCTPATCHALGAGCGDFADGCGGTLHCGACGQCETCSPQGACQSMGTVCGDNCCAGGTPQCCGTTCIGVTDCCQTGDCTGACETCDLTTHTCVVCAGGGTCVAGQCCATPCGSGPTLACCTSTQACGSGGACCTTAGNACAGDTDCCSGACVGQKCQATCGEEGAVCDDAGDCCGGWTCANGGGTGVCCASGAACGATCCASASAICTGSGCCAPDPKTTTCNGKCGTVTNNCGQSVACGNTCDTSKCQFCDANSHTCAAVCDPTATCCHGSCCGAGSFCCDTGVVAVCCTSQQTCTPDGSCQASIGDAGAGAADGSIPAA